MIGSKFYRANNTSKQGPGSDGSDANFDFQLDDFPNYPDQNEFIFPNLNVSVFGENIFYVTDKLSITPGFRLEYIKTESDGFSRDIGVDGAGNVIRNNRVDENFVNERTFALLGIGTSYKVNTSLEFYGNISQNYRSVTYTDISTVNPAFEINPDITDEDGFTADIGARGNFKDYVSYDASIFSLAYKDRIGFRQIVSDGRVKSERANIGDAFIYGLESLVDFNLNKLFIKDSNYVFNLFFNTSVLSSEYTKSQVSGVEGNKVEFIPELNFKTGMKFGYKNFLASVQYSYLSEQFTDASNAVDGVLSGLIGAIPAYDIVDFSISYTYNRRFKLEAGINNVLDNAYFTRRATGYPGPGIIPSPNRNYYLTLEIKI